MTQSMTVFHTKLCLK